MTNRVQDWLAYRSPVSVEVEMSAGKETLQRAHEILANHRECFDIAGGGNYFMGIVRALDAAGLLASDLHREALNVCEDLASNDAASRAKNPRGYEMMHLIEAREAIAVGKKSLAAKAAAKGPRWEAKEREGWSGWHVHDTAAGPAGWTEKQARAVAAALNAADEGQVRP